MRKVTIFNIIIFGILQIVTIFYGFILPKITIETYGSNINGLISSIKQFVSMMAILELGIGSVSTYALYKPIHEQNNEKISRIYQSIKAHYRIIGLIFSISLLVLAALYPLLNNSINLDYFYIMILFIVIGISSLLEYLFIGKYRALIRAQNKEYVISSIQILILFINFVISLYLINQKIDILLVYIASTSSYFLRPILYRIYIVRNFNLNNKATPDNKALSQRWDSFVHQISALIMSNIDIVIITILFSFSFVSVYTIYIMIFMALSRMINILTNSLTNAFGNIISQNNLSLLRSSYEKIEYIIILLSSVIYSSTSFLIRPFLILYTRNFIDSEIYIIPLLISLFVITEYVHKLKAAQNILVTASGNFKSTRKNSIFETLLNLIFTIIGAFIFGFYGVILGTLIALSYRLIDLKIFVSKKILFLNPNRSMLKILINFLLLFIIVIAGVLTNNIVTSNNYFEWILQSVMTVSIFALVFSGINLVFFKNDFINTIMFILGKRGN